jgi:hypothetical protein
VSHFIPIKAPSKNADPTDFHFFIAQLNLPFHFYWWHECKKKMKISTTLNDRNGKRKMQQSF